MPNTNLAVYVKTKKDRPALHKYRVKVGQSCDYRIKQMGVLSNLKRKKPDFSLLKEKSDLMTLTNAVALYGATIFSNHVTRILYLLLQTLSTSIINS